MLLGKRKDERVLTVGKIPAVFAAGLGRKDEVYTWEVDDWQNNKGSGARARKGCRKTRAWSPSLHWGGFSGTQQEQHSIKLSVCEFG